MTWTTTLEVVDCASTGTKLAGAKVELGLVEIGLTNAAGRIDAVLDDFNTLPIFKVSKADYVTDNFVLDKSIYAGNDKIADRSIAQEDRVLMGNALFDQLKKYCRSAKSQWFSKSEARFNDYIIYKTPSGKHEDEASEVEE